MKHSSLLVLIIFALRKSIGQNSYKSLSPSRDNSLLLNPPFQRRETMSSLLTGLTPAQIASLPITAPPPGVIPNFVDPVSRSHEIYIPAGVCLAFMFLFASLRLYAKLFIQKRRDVDDCRVLPPVNSMMLLTCF